MTIRDQMEAAVLLTQLQIARAALQEIADIAVPDGGDPMKALHEAQSIAVEAIRQAGLSKQ